MSDTIKDTIDNQSEEINLKDIQLYKNPDDNWKNEKINGRMVDIPCDWNVDKLGNKIIVKSGKANARDDEKDGIYPLYDRSEIIKKSNTYIFDNEALIYPGEGKNFIPKYYKGKYNLHQRAYCLTSFIGSNPFFMSEMLKRYKQDFLRLSVGSTVPSLRKPIFEGFDYISAIDEIEENNISNITKKQENLIISKKQYLKKWKKQRKYFQQELLSGRLRIKLNNNSIQECIKLGLIENKVVDFTKNELLEQEKIDLSNNIYEIIEDKKEEFDNWLIKDFDIKIEFYKNADNNWKSERTINRYFKIPNEWNNIDLGKLCNVKTGKLDANQGNKNGKYRFYTCAENYSYIDNFAFDTEALLVSGNGAKVGYIHYYNGKFNAYQRTYILDDFKLNIHFIKKYLEFYLPKRIDFEKSDNNVPYIIMSTLTEMNIFLPNNLEQILISTQLTKLDNIIETLEEEIQKEEKQFTYLKQELLSGRLRVK